MSRRPPPHSSLIDERIPRVVAAATMALVATVLVTGWWGLLIPLTGDFLARASGRSAWSPLAALGRSVVRRRSAAPGRRVAARPKQFAAGIGAVVSGAAGTVALLGNATAPATVLLVLLLAAASLEAALGFCVGCRVHSMLAAAGVVAEDCPECSNLALAGNVSHAGGDRTGP